MSTTLTLQLAPNVTKVTTLAKPVATEATCTLASILDRRARRSVDSSTPAEQVNLVATPITTVTTVTTVSTPVVERCDLCARQNLHGALLCTDCAEALGRLTQVWTNVVTRVKYVSKLRYDNKLKVGAF